MSKSSKRRAPKYQHHKPRNQARVTIDGKTYYLGTYDSTESHQKYHQLIAEWHKNGQVVADLVSTDDKANELTIVELMASYLTFARGYYVKQGKPTREYGCTAEACRPLRQLYETTLAVEFGPRALKNVRQKMIDLGWSRKYINKQVGRINSHVSMGSVRGNDSGQRPSISKNSRWA